MRNIILLYFLLLIYGEAEAQQWQWLNKISSGVIYLPPVKTDSFDNIFSINYTFDKPLNFGSTHASTVVFDGNSFLVKYSKTGDIRWIKPLDSLKNNGLVGLTLDRAGNIFLAYDNHGNVCILKLDNDGTELWRRSEKIPGSATASLHALTTDGEGNIILAGSFSRTNTPREENPTDLFMIKYDSTGALQWMRNKAYYDGFIYVQDMHTGSDGTIYLAGDGSNLRFTGLRDSVKLPPGNYLAKYSAAGEPMWAQTLDYRCENLRLAIDNSSFYISGRFNQETDIGGIHLLGSGTTSGFLAKFTGNGDVTWAKAVGTEWAALDGIDIDKENKRIYTSGGFSRHLNIRIDNQERNFYSTDYLGYNLDFFVLGFDTLGTPVYINVVETIKGQMWGNVSVSPSGNLAVAGLFWGNCVFRGAAKNDTITGHTNESRDLVIGYLSNCSTAVSIGSMNPACLNSPPFMLTTGQPAGGIYSGKGVSNGRFYPATAGGGRHWIKYTYSGSSCTSASDSTQIEVYSCTAIAETRKDRLLKVYPNPAENLVSVISQEPLTKIDVYNVLGELIFSKPLQSMENRLILSDYPPGVYTIKAKTLYGDLIAKIIKQ